VWRCALILLVATPAWACSCSGWQRPKQAWQKAPVVIYGTVVFADPEVGTMFHQQRVRIQTDEAFKGAKIGDSFDLELGGTDCDVKFSNAERVLLYLYRDRTSGSWYLPWCSGAGGTGALAFLRGLPKSAQGTRLSGEVELYEDHPTKPFQRVGAVPGVSVVISGPDGKVFEAVTNAEGVYERYGLAPGRYSVTMNAPKGWRIKFPIAIPQACGEENATDLTPNGDASVSFVLQPDTRISGSVLDQAGKPVPHVCMNLMEKEGRGEQDAFFFECSKEGDGTFKFEMMPPGEYRIIAHDDVKIDGRKSRSTAYVPGVRDREQARIIKVETGKYVSGLELRIPADEKRYEFSGHAEYTDGVPVVGSVTFSSERSGYTERIEIRPDGSFVLPVVAGMDGELYAGTGLIMNLLTSCPQFKVVKEGGMIVTAETPKLPLTSDSDHRDLKLVMPFASCKSPARK
jgi:hypothetical protein